MRESPNENLTATQRVACLGLIGLLVLWPHTAAATLGSDASSVAADRIRGQGALISATSVGSYRVEEMQMASGTTVREFTSSTGQVFGVAWQGPWMPDLQQLLGPYFDRYQAAAQAAQARRSRGPIVLDTPDLVIHSSGHARAFTGSAFLPALMPAGVQAQSIH
jgi:hypothetical protein